MSSRPTRSAGPKAQSQLSLAAAASLFALVAVLGAQDLLAAEQVGPFISMEAPAGESGRV
jgi:hypothetical protein